MKNQNCKKTLINYVDSIFVVEGEMISDNGEDSYMFAINDNYGIVGVFDGCGGLGSRRYPEYNNKSGAYISSRIVSVTVMKWFEETCNANFKLSLNNVKDVCEDLKKVILSELKLCEQKTNINGIKGSMTKNFPTTSSIILFEHKNETLYSYYIWSGDSRGFILNEYGLAQITKDDIADESDAFDNISNDSCLTNVISAKNDFKLNRNVISCKSGCILITATDGCFAYFATPMEFEYMLTDTLLKSRSIDEWKCRINSFIKKYTADDYTIGIVVYGYDEFKKLKKNYIKRHEFIKNNYINKLSNADKNKAKQLWDEYKSNYYRGI